MTRPGTVEPPRHEHDQPPRHGDARGGTGPARVRARVTPRRLFDRSNVPVEERERLAGSLGARLRAVRVRAGLSVRELADAAGCATSTVRRLERGEMRPRPSMLRSLAEVLRPSRPAPLTRELCDLAGGSLRPDTAAGIAARARRVRRARLRYGRLVRREQDLTSASLRISARALSAADVSALDLTADVSEGQLRRHEQVLTRIRADLDAVDALRREAARLDVAIARHPRSRGARSNAVTSP